MHTRTCRKSFKGTILHQLFGLFLHCNPLPIKLKHAGLQSLRLSP